MAKKKLARQVPLRPLMRVKVKLCALPNTHPRAFHSAHGGAHIFYFASVVYEGHGFALWGAGAMLIFTLYGIVFHNAQKG